MYISCPECKKENDEGADYCERCRYRLAEPASKVFYEKAKKLAEAA